MISLLKERGDNASSLEFFLEKNITKEKSILDIGCNFGTLVNMLDQQGYHKSFGIDSNGDAIDQGKLHYPGLTHRLHTYAGNKLPYSDCSWDVVTAFDVLEHIPNLANYLKEIRRILVPGGILLFQTPNKYTNIPWEIIQKRHFTLWKTYHCSLQTFDSLQHILSDAGFTKTTLFKRSSFGPHTYQKVRKKMGRFGLFLLRIFRYFPHWMQTNFWGEAVK